MQLQVATCNFNTITAISIVIQDLTIRIKDLVKRVFSCKTDQDSLVLMTARYISSLKASKNKLLLAIILLTFQYRPGSV